MEAFSELSIESERFMPLEVNLKSDESVAKSIEMTIDKFGMIYVFVNNAGYGPGGALEELSADEMSENFEIFDDLVSASLTLTIIFLTILLSIMENCEKNEALGVWAYGDHSISTAMSGLTGRVMSPFN